MVLLNSFTHSLQVFNFLSSMDHSLFYRLQNKSSPTYSITFRQKRREMKVLLILWDQKSEYYRGL